MASKYKEINSNKRKEITIIIYEWLSYMQF